MANIAKTQAVGIFQGDLILRSMLVAAIADLRANPYLLRYAFASLAQDPLTRSTYGEQELQRAVDWFQKTNISVVLSITPDTVNLPAIGITLAGSAEDDSTLGDVHYQPEEDASPETWAVLVGPLSPLDYDAATGILKLPPDSLNHYVLAGGMVVVDRQGNRYPILSVEDESTVVIAPGVTTSLEDMVISTCEPSLVTQLESVVTKETYLLHCVDDEEAVRVVYLHAILSFILYRYKEKYLEARGLERTVFTATDLARQDQLLPEYEYQRLVQLTGYARQVWPKDTNPKITATYVDPAIKIGKVEENIWELDAFDQAAAAAEVQVPQTTETAEDACDCKMIPGPPGPRGVQGPRGPKGDKGDPGDSGGGIPTPTIDRTWLGFQGGVVGWFAIQQADIVPTFDVTSLSLGTGSLEVGQSFTPSYGMGANRAIASAPAPQVIDNLARVDVLTPSGSTASGTGAHSYSRATPGSLSWTGSATGAAGGSDSIVATASWFWRGYWGEANPPGSYNAAFITSLAHNGLLAASAGSQITGTGGGVKKLYFCPPAGITPPSFFTNLVTGFAFPFTKVASNVSVTNGFSIVVLVDVWESDAAPITGVTALAH